MTKIKLNSFTFILSLTFASLTPHAFANVSFSTQCPDIQSCTKVVSELLGQKYVFDKEIKGKVRATSNLQLNKKNAELLFTNLLYLQGYSRVPLNEPNTFQIVQQKDARDSVIPSIRADQKNAPFFPNTWDLMTLQYKASYPETVDQLARTSRSFVPANARIIPSEINGTVYVTDAAVNLKKLYELLRELDRKPTAEMKKRWEHLPKSFH